MQDRQAREGKNLWWVGTAGGVVGAGEGGRNLQAGKKVRQAGRGKAAAARVGHPEPNL